MFSNLLDDPQNELIRNRLSRLQDQLRGLILSTREEYQAEVYSRVNAVLALGNTMRPLLPVLSEGPAIVGDISGNYSQLNQDATDIASEILDIENTAARLFNLAASSQNALRQQIREAAFRSNKNRFIEPFINQEKIASSTAELDFATGVAMLPLVSETSLSPAITIGAGSVGTGTGIAALADGLVETAMVFNGTLLELILSFDAPQIVNRLTIAMDDYQGLEISTLTSSPDGTLFEDVLADLGVSKLELDATSDKYAGTFTLDFPPRHVTQMRLVITDRVDQATIALRALALSQRSYDTSAQITSIPISLSGSLAFTADALSSDGLTSITHLMSADGVHYQVIQPGATITVDAAPFWYSAKLERLSQGFTDDQSPLSQPSLDPVGDPGYQVTRVTSIPLGAGVIERTIVVSNIGGPIVLRDPVIPGTLKLQRGAVYLTSDDFSFVNNVISFPQSVDQVTITYQTSSLGTAALSQREAYYTPLLREVRFSK